MRTTLVFTLALIAAVACSKDKKRGDERPAAPEQTAPAPEAARPKAPEAPAHVLANMGGVFALDASGGAVHQYTETPASKPRFVPNSRDLIFFQEDGRKLVRLSLATGEEKVLASIPEPAQCGSELGLRVQADWDFTVDAGGQRACLRLYDRNENMADVGVVARVDLRTGKVESAVALGMDCPTDEHADDLFDCTPAPSAEIEPSALSREEVDAKQVPKGFDAELRSPSGRWAVLAGEPEQGDYIYRAILLLDTKSGELFPIAEGAWPKPLARAAVEGGDYQTASAVGESTLEWLGGDLLHFDHMLIRPGLEVVELEGDLAR